MTASMRIPMVVGSEKVILNVGVLVELVLKIYRSSGRRIAADDRLDVRVESDFKRRRYF